MTVQNRGPISPYSSSSETTSFLQYFFLRCFLQKTMTEKKHIQSFEKKVLFVLGEHISQHYRTAWILSQIYFLMVFPFHSYFLMAQVLIHSFSCLSESHKLHVLYSLLEKAIGNSSSLCLKINLQKNFYTTELSAEMLNP